MPYIANGGALYLYAKWFDLYPVTSISLDKSSITGFSNIGYGEQLRVTDIQPTNANNKAIRWESTNTNVATVDGNGYVKLHNAGTATIKCISVGNPSAYASCTVTVKQSVTGITLNESNIFRYSDSMSPIQLTANVQPNNAYDKSVTWTSDNPAVAEVSDTGLVTLKALGTATITCSSVTNPNVTATCPVAVRQAVTGITLDRESQLRTNADMSPLKLVPTIAPEDAYNKNLTWETSNPNTATVSEDGTISMKDVGTTTITCRSVSNPNITATFELEIIQAVTEITLNETAVTRYSDEQNPIQLIPDVKPDDAGNKNVTWETSDPGVVTVSQNGLVTVVAAGNAIVTCRSVSNPDVTGECRVTILQAVTGITLNKTAINTTSDEINVTYLLETIAPDDAYNKAVTWASSDDTVATVASDGVVTIKGVGDAIVTCRSVSTPYITATCTVHVVQAVSGIRLSETSIYRYSNQTGNVQITADVTAAETANKEVRWSSDHTDVATVSNSGIVSIQGVGTTIITCTSVSNPEIHAECLVTVRQSVTGISLDKTSIERRSDDETPIQLIASVSPANAANKNLVCSSSDNAVATVSDSGLVQITGAGSAVITCHSVSDPEISASCAVTVRQAVTSLSLNTNSIVRNTNETGTIQLVAYVRPSYAYNKVVTWGSSDETVATVTTGGVVRIIGAGEAVITCTSTDNPSLTATCDITVKQAVASVTLDQTSITLFTNQTEPIQLNAVIQPQSVANAKLIWTSSDETVVTVSDNGVIGVVGTGNAVITCKAADNQNASDTCSVTVKQAVLSITLNETDLVCFQDESGLRLAANVQPVYAEDKSVTWTSNKTSVATVSNTGVLTLKKAGSAVITCTSVSNPDVYAQCRLTVKQPMTAITLNRSFIELSSNDETGVQLIATITPANTDDTAIFWQSDNTDVAVVSDTGLVTAVGKGTAHVYCRSVRNPDTIFAACDVAVAQRVEEIHVEGDTASLLPGETVQLSAICYPEQADNSAVNWSTDNSAIATVDESGLVTAVSYGTAEITATAADGSGASGSYSVSVTHELSLNTLIENDMVYAQGNHSVILATVSADSASVRRMAERGNELTWSLVKPDENDDVEIEIIPTTVTDRGQEYETTYVVLSGSEFSASGARTYTVNCTAGVYSASAQIPIVVDGTDYAELVTLSPSTFEINTGEAAVIPNAPVSADGKPVPSSIMLNSVNGDGDFTRHSVSYTDEDGYHVSFDESGIYTATVYYEAVNLVYEVNVTFYVYDENGIVRIKAEQVSLDNSYVTLVQGDQYHLTVAVSPIDAFDTSVTWSSTDESIAIVDQNGLITAVAPGKAAIIATANDGSGASDICAVNVETFLQLDDEVLDFTVYTSGNTHADLGIVNVTIDSEKRIMNAGLNVTWTMQRIRGNACEIAVEEFRAEAEEGITVSGNQIKLLRVNGVGEDEYLLTCKAGSYSTSCVIHIHVLQAVLPETIALVHSQYTGKVSETITIDTTYTGTALPEETKVEIRGSSAFENALSEAYDFTEPEKLVFSVPGTYTANVVFSGDNYSYSCPITIIVQDADGNVPVNITNISIDPDAAYLMIGDQEALTAVFEPTDAPHGKLTWTSSNTSVVTVSAAGLVTAIGAGNAFITVSVPESDFAGGCFVVVEDGLTLQSDSIDRTVFVDGITRTELDSVQLTVASSQRLENAPEWTLTRISGNNLTLRTKEYNTSDEDGNTVYGCSIVLYSLSREGVTEYELSCKAGHDEVTVPVTVRAVNRDMNLPSGLSLSQTVFTANVNELITIIPEIVCLPTGTVLPDGMRVTLAGNELFNSFVNIPDYCVSQNMTTLSFSDAGVFEANFIYSYSNMRYAVPVTFRIKDAEGNVPVLTSSVSLSSESLWLVTGETADISAVFTPANADNQRVTWVSTDEAVVAVDANGHVTAVGNGQAAIVCIPEDSRLNRLTCIVRVEDYLTFETGEEYTRLYKQGAQANEVFSVLLSEGTIHRLEKAGITPTWNIVRISGNHSDASLSISEQGSKAVVSSTTLISGGSDIYRVTCTAGNQTKSAEFMLEVIDIGDVAAYITPAQSSVNAAVGQTFTVDFTPVCHPAGSVLPENSDMWYLYAGLGTDFQNAVDYDVYDEDGDTVTLRFTQPGRYLFTRQFFLDNLHYEQVCEINVGQSASQFKLLQADTSEALVYLGGKTGRVASVSLTDTLMFDVFDNDIQWSLARISGNSLTAVLKNTANGVDLYATHTSQVGEDVWRVTCTFGERTESIDIHVSVRESRSPIPESVALSVNHISGMIGDWLNMPIAEICSPAGSALPETGDAFWSFEPLGTAADVCSWNITDKVLRVKILYPGYYTGLLKYEAGSFTYSNPVYLSITDEEGILNAPAMEVYLLNMADTVYLSGESGVVIGNAEVSRGIGTYYAGEASAYTEAHQGIWSISVTSGTAATLAVEATGNNTARILLTSIKKAGSINYSVQFTMEGTVYTKTGKLSILDRTAAQPEPTLKQSTYYGKPGEMLTIPTTVYERGSGTILQSSTKWVPDAFLQAIGYEYTETGAGIQVTFYEEGTYSTSVTAVIGNLTYELPFTIVISNTEVSYAVMHMPAALTAIQAYAFEGCKAEIVDLRGTRISQIGEGAFSNCADLVTIYIPSSVTDIGENVFYGCLNVTIVCQSGSAADQYAASHHIPVRYE